MKVTPWIAWRYFLSKRVGRFGPLLTIVAIASVAIGIFSLAVVMSVMRGFKAELGGRMMGFNSHITITAESEGVVLNDSILKSILKDFDLKTIAPYAQGEVIAESHTTGELYAQGARVKGIDSTDFIMGNGIEVSPHGKIEGAVVGKEIVSQLVVHPSFQDEIELVAPLADIGPSGEFVPNKKKFLVTGVFRSGVYEYDSKFILLPLDEARQLLGLQATNGWQIWLDDESDAGNAVGVLNEKLPDGWKAIGWHEQNKKLFDALKLERVAMGSILVMALLIASLSIVGVIFLISSAKRKDMAILEAMGMSKKNVAKIFVFNAACIGGMGAFIGLFFGVITGVILERWPLPLPDSYYLDYLPVDLNVGVMVLFALIGIAMSMLAAFYPVRQAVKTNNIVDVLRYE